MESIVNRPAPTLSQGRRQGQTLLVVLMLSSLLVALSGAQFALVQKNTRQTSFLTTHSELRHYASSGIHISLHDLQHSVTGNLGKIGSILWTPSTAHVFGTLMVQNAFSVIDENELRVTGTTDIYYCSAVIDTVNDYLARLGAGYDILYWDYLN